MAQFPDEIRWSSTRFDRFLALSSWLAAALYAAPAAAILAFCSYAPIPERFWTPILVIYLVGAIAHALNYGFTAINIQIKTSIDYIMTTKRHR